jgi:hypothetical protein
LQGTERANADDQAEAALRARHINTFPMKRLNVKDWTDGETGVRLSSRCHALSTLRSNPRPYMRIERST